MLVSAQCLVSAHGLHRNPPPHWWPGCSGSDPVTKTLIVHTVFGGRTPRVHIVRRWSSSSHVTVTEAKPPCPCLQCDARPVSAPNSWCWCCRVRGRRYQPTSDSPWAGLGWAGLAGLGWAGTRPQMLIGAQIWACHLVTLGQVTPPPHVPTCHQSNYHTFM